MLHKEKIICCSSGNGDQIYVIFVHNIGYVRYRSSWQMKSVALSDSTDYYLHLVDTARKTAIMLEEIRGKPMVQKEEITLITREGCTYCYRAKQLLKQEGYEFEERHIGLDITRDQILAMYPDQKVIPIILLDGVLLGGFNELDAWLFPPLEEKEEKKEDSEEDQDEFEDFVEAAEDVGE